MRIFVTGGAGFIGKRVVAQLVAGGHSVLCVVRNPGTAGVVQLGADVAAGTLRSRPEIERQMQGADAVVHLAGSYKVGISVPQRPEMYDANVGTTERVLDAAVANGVSRIVYVSTINTFGNTKGVVVDETYRRDPADGFLSYYDETKYRAHLVAEERAAAGAPIVIAQPGGVIGPGDPSQVGRQLRQAHDGALRYLALTDVGLSFVYVDDVAAGIVAALERGRVGESYVLGGTIGRLKDGLAIAARLAGRRLPRFGVPVPLLRFVARHGPSGDRLGLPPNLAEIIGASDRVTYWARHDKAARELGYAPRALEAALTDTFDVERARLAEVALAAAAAPRA
ncbi:MAG: NAD-dependent epimerase/dehydratase family protein [Chloroflexota bacterium]